MKYLHLFIIFLYGVVWSQSVLDNDELHNSSGLFTTYYDDDKGKMYMEVSNLDSSFIYVSSLSQGVGNNDLGLDRGQIGGTRIVSFRRSGNKLLLIQPNLRYRAITANELERKSVEEAFAKSVLYGFEILEETQSGYLIDLTDFLMQDTHGVLEVLKVKKQGDYSLDETRSSLNMERTKNFPKNVDFDVLITLKGVPAGKEIRSVTPDSKYITVYQHHSFVELPNNNYQPRIAHPNSGSITTSFMNYSASIDQAMEVNYCWRHRLEKKSSGAKSSEAVEPIIYYLDNGTPEPIRSALMEGAGWWNEAFEHIGYTNAFQVKILPDAIDPLDVRYNVIQWVHRSTRGWSYGGGVVDPRTGEIIKGHVSLGSLRVRQDYKIAKALTNGADSQAMKDFALARIRQLGAHEVGHTLGFSHNFAASIKNRASVMDYPHPWVTVTDGSIDISNAYGVGIGEWDKVTVAYSYGDYQGNEHSALKKVIGEAMSKGYRFISDADARPIGSANVHGHLWDNGSNPIDELRNVMDARSLAIAQFDSDVLVDGESFAELEDLFVLLYYYHRYQVEAAIKTIAGREYNFGLKGETEIQGKVVLADEQRRALEAVLGTLDVDFLAIPKSKLNLFPDRGWWQERNRESFDSKTGWTFDPLTAAEAASDFVLARLLHPARVNRLVSQSAIDVGQLGLREMLDSLINRTLKHSSSDPYKGNVEIVIKSKVLSNLLQLAQNEATYPQVKATVHQKLSEFKELLEDEEKKTAMEDEWIQTIENYYRFPQNEIKLQPAKVPDGSPIGSFLCSGP
ncbi:MAG: DUF5117 domain-containing protein [Saprospiraceae bacterium]|nr:DUF5117 domain-containing protein [Saprospiraceae bacterium]